MPPVALPNAEGEFTLFGKHFGATPSNTGSPFDEKRVVKIRSPALDGTGGARIPIAAEPRELGLERFAYRFGSAGMESNDV
jgi:hypothetical protein